MYYANNQKELHYLDSEEFAAMLPEGYVQITDEEAQEIINASKPSPASIRKIEITAELQTIDTDSARPARAVAVALAAGTPPNAFDLSKLQALEAKAAALRAELIAL